MKKFFSKIINWLKEHWKLTLFIVVVLVLIAGLITNKAKKNQPKLNFVRPSIETLTQTLEVSGVIDAQQKADLRFVAGGKLVYLGVQEGDWVKKWQTIASIDQASLQKSQEKYLNAYMQERWDWDQLGDDTKDRTLPKDELRDKDQAQWDLTNTVLDVEIQNIAIANTRMTAPFAGLVTHTPVQTTGVVLLATDYFEIVNPDTLYFKAQVDEEDIAKINLGQTGRLILDAYTDETINTNLDYIAYQATQTSGGTVFEVRFPLSQVAANLEATQSSQVNSSIYQQLLSKYRLRMNGDIAIELAKKENVLSIPILATTKVDEQIYVEIKNADGTTSKRAIKTGLETDEKVEVLEGLSQEDEIVLPE